MSARASQVRAHVAQRAALKVVRRSSSGLIKRGRARRFAPVGMIAGIVVGAIVLAVLLEQVVLAQSAFQLSHINERLVVAESRNNELQLEAAKLESPGRIERYARTKLGMVDPLQVQYIVADTSSGERSAVADGTRRHRMPVEGQAAADAGSSDGAGATP